jgi:hypothetical protein
MALLAGYWSGPILNTATRNLDLTVVEKGGVHILLTVGR